MKKQLVWIFFIVLSISFSQTTFAANGNSGGVDFGEAFNSLVADGATESEALTTLLQNNPNKIKQVVAAVLNNASTTSASDLLTIAFQSVAVGHHQKVIAGANLAGTDSNSVDTALAAASSNLPSGLGNGPHGNRPLQTPGVNNRGRGGGGGSPS